MNLQNLIKLTYFKWNFSIKKYFESYLYISEKEVIHTHTHTHNSFFIQCTNNLQIIAIRFFEVSTKNYLKYYICLNYVDFVC